MVVVVAFIVDMAVSRVVVIISVVIIKVGRKHHWSCCRCCFHQCHWIGCHPFFFIEVIAANVIVISISSYFFLHF